METGIEVVGSGMEVAQIVILAVLVTSIFGLLIYLLRGIRKVAADLQQKIFGFGELIGEQGALIKGRIDDCVKAHLEISSQLERLGLERLEQKPETGQNARGSSR